MALVSSASAGLRAAAPSPSRGEGLERVRATIVQLRAPALTGAELEREARHLVADCRVPVVVSSRCDVALASGAAGVNLPESDIPVAGARTLLGRLLVGRSVHSVSAAKLAEREGADFVIFGPVWQSESHPGAEPAGLNALKQVVLAVRLPVLAIGGVTLERIAECHTAGAAGYAAIGMFR